LSLLNGRGAVAGFADDLHVGQTVDEQRDCLSNRRMIVGQENTEGARHLDG
jgi:hypothetical protein